MKWFIVLAEREPYCIDSVFCRPTARLYSDRFVRHLFSIEYGLARTAALTLRRAFRKMHSTDRLSR